jgi:hypothetical protein
MSGIKKHCMKQRPQVTTGGEAEYCTGDQIKTSICGYYVFNDDSTYNKPLIIESNFISLIEPFTFYMVLH